MRKWTMRVHEYFQEGCRYDSDCSRGLKHTPWATSDSNIMAQDPYNKDTQFFRQLLPCFAIDFLFLYELTS